MTHPELAACRVVPVLADIQGRERLRQVFREWAPRVVFHAAAHEHVPLMENHPGEAVKNNILGTHNLLLVSQELPPLH